MRLVSVPELTTLADGERIVKEIDDASILVVREGDQFYVVENRCPHRGAPLVQASLKDGCLTCAWHGLQFNLATGASTASDGLQLKSYPVVQQGDGYFIELPDADEQNSIAKGVRVALVRYGTTGQIGWFGTIHNFPLHRAAQVIVETAIGPQLGEVLLGDDEAHRQSPGKDELRGEIAQLAVAVDFERNRQASQFASQHYATVQSRLEAVGHSVVELETTLDQRSITVWLLSTPDAALGILSVELPAILGVEQVRFLQRRQTDTPVASTTRYNENQSRKNARGEGNTMKGPGLRQKNELDRLWECPSCHYHERTSGMQTTLVCPKCIKPESGARTSFMKLTSSPATAPRRSFQVVSNTPVPVPVVTILGEDTARIPKKQSLRPAPNATSSETEPQSTSEAPAATSPETADPPTTASPQSE